MGTRLFSAAAFVAPDREHSKVDDEAELRDVIDAITHAVRTKDVEALLAHCAPDIATFDMVPPLKHEGPDAIRLLWATSLAEFRPPLEYEMHELDIAIGDDIAFCRSLNRFGGTEESGRHIVNWLCSTLGFRKLDGRWKLVHQHVSVPFDMVTGRAMLDLKP